MLRQLASAKLYIPIIISNRHYSDRLIALLGNMLKVSKSNTDLYVVENGSSRYWDLTANDKTVCVGGLGPMKFNERKRKAHLIDFNNKDSNKLHIKMFHCPTLLAAKLINSFPKFSLRRDNLKIIELSHKHYQDQDRGYLDSLMACNYLCEIIHDEGDFAIYSGNAYEKKGSIHLGDTRKFFGTDNIELHASFKRKNGYLNINNLKENDAGLIYTDTDLSIETLALRLSRRNSISS